MTNPTPKQSYPGTVQQLREALPRYVSDWAREVASEAIDDMEDECGEARAYYLARWFDAMRADPTPKQSYPEVADLGRANRAFHDALRKYPDAFEALHYFWNEGIAGVAKARCSHCGNGYGLHHDKVSGFHHVIGGETVPCALASTQETGEG